MANILDLTYPWTDRHTDRCSSTNGLTIIRFGLALATEYILQWHGQLDPMFVGQSR